MGARFLRPKRLLTLALLADAGTGR